MREQLRGLGLPGETLEIWFARLLRNAFALDASGTYQPFGEVARRTLEVLVSVEELECGRDIGGRGQFAEACERLTVS